MNAIEFMDIRITYNQAIERYAASEKTLVDMADYIKAICDYSQAQDDRIEYLEELLEEAKTTLERTKDILDGYTRR